MNKRNIKDLLEEHPVFAGLNDQTLGLIAGCSKNVRFDPEGYIAKEGDPANTFYVIRKGKVALETHVPEKGPVRLQTLAGGDVVGWSWIFPPYKWMFDAVPTELVIAIAIDGKCLRGKCDADPELGYALMQRFAQIMTQRLRATRLQLLDVYGGR